MIVLRACGEFAKGDLLRRREVDPCGAVFGAVRISSEAHEVQAWTREIRAGTCFGGGGRKTQAYDVEPVDLFIGFDRPSAFDMPLVATGNEDLYFTVSPSPYMDAQTLRRILYDHLYARRVDDADYALSAQEMETLGRFYRLNQHRVLGLGRKHRRGAFWYPIPQVELLPEMQDDR